MLLLGKALSSSVGPLSIIFDLLVLRRGFLVFFCLLTSDFSFAVNKRFSVEFLLSSEVTELSVCREFLSSIFAIIGVALFAQWSILSNITASFIIFFNFPYKIGDEIKVIDTDGDISGTIVEISLFHVLIQQGEDLITYPNSLILQKAVIKKKNNK